MQLSDAARALRELPDGQREALILVSAGGLSYDDAAKVCSIPVGTMKSRVARGRVALLKMIDGEAPVSTRQQIRVTDGSHDILVQLGALTKDSAHHTGAGAAAP